jgi:hypothetical protein
LDAPVSFLVALDKVYKRNAGEGRRGVAVINSLRHKFSKKLKDVRCPFDIIN